MRIKTKLNLGVGLLFLMIIILSLVSAYAVFLIKQDTENILKSNYNTLEYSRNMISALDIIKLGSKETIQNFEENLEKQTHNITEPGEKQATEKLKESFALLAKNNSDETVKGQIRQDIFAIMKLNLDAIKQKSDIAKKTAETSNFSIAIVGTLCFLIAFNLLVNLPNNIANPIRELTLSIKEIANKNYSERVHFTSHSEFGDLAKSFNTMAQKLEEYHDSNVYKLLFEKKRLETLINNMNDPIIGLDNEEIVLFANDEALKIIGLKSEDIIGKTASELANTNDLIRSLILKETNGNSKKQPLKIFANAKESYFEKETINITITPTGEEKEINIGEVIILRNITLFKELDFAKTNFIATVSHELKTPIASIKLSLQLLENSKTGDMNEDQKQLIESIKDDSQRLLKITGELLNLSQLETGNIQLNIEKSNPYAIVNYAAEAVKVQADQKQIQLIINADENLKDVKADAEKTGWVLINYLSNAIRYSAEKSTILIKLKEENNQIVFQVIDTGKGIEPRYKDKVFDKYFQIPGSQKSGTGLGLAISKEFIEAQNGSVGVESNLGLGSTFWFTLKV
ncbi:HAMP domain-containing sensor histidine kinase [Flavobacterium chungangense]|uniref:histidine kinase n=1 Tax=Flavobacterium chungangense TaxID=554283 RepID=A0A6V6YWH0_9FLAO|nr:ATP-binding protein [Flavobacterium chungangense]CAD0003820.1 PAS domain-containing sensor histidine kinase [Flavobacterium chungangense]